MTKTMPETDIGQLQHELLQTPLGVPGSGFIRYSAAMYFHTIGELSAERLEAYRICCNLDDEDPLAVEAHRHRADPG
ncbi:MAG: hypothetical protein R3D32_15660 [Nitratireductor sp.]